MSDLSLSGRVVRSTDLAPLPDVSVRLSGPAHALGGLPGAQPLTEAPPFTWTRPLTGFSGSRWDCWTAQVQNQVQGITWAQFKVDSLIHNPQLVADGYVFKPDKSYFIPQNDTTPRAFLTTKTDAQGNYSFALGAQPVTCALQVEVPGYTSFALSVAVNGAVNQPVALIPQPSSSPVAAPAPAAAGPVAVPSVPGGVRSARADYGSLPEKARRVIDQALFMLGDDQQVFDALPPELQKMCYGNRFLSDPHHPNYKDICCADLVSVALRAAGLNIGWAATTSMADHYFPDGNPQLIELSLTDEWLPGDVLVYGPPTKQGRKAAHVNLYVGKFTGTDRSGKTYALNDSAEVVNASEDLRDEAGKEQGTGSKGVNLQDYCLQKKSYIMLWRSPNAWVRHVRLRELAALYGR